jgi:hypothetical protein
MRWIIRALRGSRRRRGGDASPARCRHDRHDDLTAFDPLGRRGRASKHKMWLHVDAADGRLAMLLPERRYLERRRTSDSLIINPHKCGCASV